MKQSILFSQYYHHLVNNKGNIAPILIYKRLKSGHLEAHTWEKKSNVTQSKLKLILLHSYIWKSASNMVDDTTISFDKMILSTISSFATQPNFRCRLLHQVPESVKDHRAGQAIKWKINHLLLRLGEKLILNSSVALLIAIEVTAPRYLVAATWNFGRSNKHALFWYPLHTNNGFTFCGFIIGLSKSVQMSLSWSLLSTYYTCFQIACSCLATQFSELLTPKNNFQP